MKWLSGAPLTLVQQRVYPRRVWRATFCLTGHLANREQQPELGVDGLEVAPVAERRSVRCSQHFTLLRRFETLSRV